MSPLVYATGTVGMAKPNSSYTDCHTTAVSGQAHALACLIESAERVELDTSMCRLIRSSPNPGLMAVSSTNHTNTYTQ